MSTTGDKNAEREFISSLSQKDRARVKPLGDKEVVALDVARYMSHVEQVRSLDQGARQGFEELQKINQRRSELAAQIQAMKNAITFFVAESREQVRVLIDKHGMTQDDVDSLCDVPEVFAHIDLSLLLPERMRDKS